MLDGPSVAAALDECGVSHVIWVPDSVLGLWEPVLSSCRSPALLRVCREGEAFALAAGLILGGKRPVVAIQCTGLFEAGDALRNAIHDLHLPIFMIVGVRSFYAHREGKSNDSCPVFTEPILQAWRIPYVVFEERHTAADLAAAYRQAQDGPGAILLAE